MNDASTAAAARSRSGPGPREFIAMMGAMMAANAMGIDTMLPALSAISDSLHIATENQRQLVISVFLFGFGAAQIVYGPLADRLGRKPVLLASLAAYAAFALLCGLAWSFPLLLAGRLLHGIAAAGSRVLVVSIVRDRHHGAGMAKIMSFVTIVFLLVPVLAPSIGQLVLAIGSWRLIFLLLAGYAVVMFAWIGLRLPETLPEDRRRSLSFTKVREAVGFTVTHRQSIGNTLALTLNQGALFGFLNSIQQIVFDTFRSGGLIGAVFACGASAIAALSFLNTRIVETFGSLRILLVGLGLFVATSALHLTYRELVGESLLSFIILTALTLACFGLMTGNLGAIAMQPLGHIAGTASAVQGVITTVGGTMIGLLIGQMYDGTTRPMIVGFLLCALVSLAVARWANRPERAPAG
jgi:DHA1 family bicyclomycin/chloramphenicol resistance-like MFS transporter